LDDIGAQTTRAILWRISYVLALLTFLNTLDRVNVSFAIITMNKDLGLDPRTYGFGVGLFFISYMAFQMPVVMLAERYGQARSIAIMVVAWGLCSAFMGLAQNKNWFYALRFLLGAIEGGSAPTVLLYTSKWAPSTLLGRFIGRNAIAMPVSFILGAPLSGWIMTRFDRLGGLEGWRWMFIVEGLGTSIVGIFAAVALDESPMQARWLNEAQRAWLRERLALDIEAHPNRPNLAKTNHGTKEKLQTLFRDTHVWWLAAAMFCITMGFYGFIYWLPQVVKMLMPQAGILTVMVVSAIPWVAAGVGMLAIGAHSDRKEERHFHIGGGAFLAALGLVLAVIASNPLLDFAALVLAGFGVGGTQGLFSSIPTQTLRGKPHAGIAFALISIFGAAAGFIGANAIGALREATGSFTSSIMFLSVIYAFGGAVIVAQKGKARVLPKSLSVSLGENDSH
jgi:MFS transporter, ACS family, tartrate transporter